MSNWVRHQSFTVSDAIRRVIASPEVTPVQKQRLVAIDREVVALSKLAHANEHMLNALKVKLCNECQNTSLSTCDSSPTSCGDCPFDIALPLAVAQGNKLCVSG